MENTAQSFDSLLRPACQPILEQALAKGTGLILTLPHGLDGHSLAERICGHISSLSGSVTRFTIKSRKTIPLTEPAKFMHGTVAADVFFSLNQSYKGCIAPIGYNAQAAVLGVDRDFDDKPVELTLRFSHELSARRMRRDERYLWSKNIPSTLGIDFIYDLPETREGLRQILTNCAANTRLFSFTPLNISAGGICLLIPPHITKSAGGAKFFFLLQLKEPQGKASLPYFLTAKKLGLHYDLETKEADGLRMQFTHELEMKKSSGHLFWQNIEHSGSARLRNGLADFFGKIQGD